MMWIAAVLLLVVVVMLYTMIINRAFLRCPHCGKVGSWRFDDKSPPVQEYDDDQCLVRSTTRQECRKCRGEVMHVWSDYEGRQIKIPENPP